MSIQSEQNYGQQVGLSEERNLSDLIVKVYGELGVSQQESIIEMVKETTANLNKSTAVYLISGLISNTHDIILAKKIGKSLQEYSIS